jgi:Xaa-Pro dipeptidase
LRAHHNNNNNPKTNLKLETDMQTLSYRTILERFQERGLLVKEMPSSTSTSTSTSTSALEAMMALNLGAYFMPCGLGHLIGLDTHDVGGYHVPPTTPTTPTPDTVAGAALGSVVVEGVRDVREGFKKNRMQRCLVEGMVLTVEPGM